MKPPLQDCVGQMLFIGVPGPDLDSETMDLLRTVQPGGVVLFRRNFVDPPQIASFTRAIRRATLPPPVLAVDQEGGRVSRLSPPFPILPAAARIGRLELSAVARWFGALTGRGLRSLGFQLDFAPVVDLSSPGSEDGIGDRAFSNQPEEVTEYAGAFLQGLEEGGVNGCLKHFPGLGGAPADTHETLPTLRSDREELSRAIAPYRRLSEKTPAVMISHGYFPALSGEDPVPASLDRRIVSDLLRKEVGFIGLTVTDDLEMGAVAGRGSFGEIAVAALLAGNDQVLVCERADRVVAAWQGLRDAAAGGHLDPGQIDASLQRIAAFKSSPICARPEEPFEEEELRLVLDEMAEMGEEVEKALRRKTDRV